MSEHEQPAGPQEIRLDNLQLNISNTDQQFGSDWVAYAVATALPVNAGNVDWNLNPRFGDEGGTAIV